MPYLCSSPSKKFLLSVSFLFAKLVYGIFIIYMVFIGAVTFPDSTKCAFQVKLIESAFTLAPVGISLPRVLLYGCRILSPIWIAFAFKELVTSVPIIRLMSVIPDKLLKPCIGFVWFIPEVSTYIPIVGISLVEIVLLVLLSELWPSEVFIW